MRGADRRAAKTITWRFRADLHCIHTQAGTFQRRFVIFLVLHTIYRSFYLHLFSLTSLIQLARRSAARDIVSVLVTSLHGDVHQSVRVSVLQAKPYRVCQCECLSVCVLVSVSLIEKAGARPERMGGPRACCLSLTRERTRRRFVWEKRRRFTRKSARIRRRRSHRCTPNKRVPTSAPHVARHLANTHSPFFHPCCPS